jgi:hypothetical protein
MKAALAEERREALQRAAFAAGAERKPARRPGSLKRFITACLVLSLGIILAYHFFLFWTAGRVLIEEPNKIILGLESTLSLGIIVFGLEQLVRS